MYTVTIREHIMIAHSLPDPAFGPAQQMHGATYVVDVSFYAPELNAQNIVIDIAIAHDVTKKVLNKLNYQNLDNLAVFTNQLTTTEFLAKYIHDEIKEAVKHEFIGKMKVVLNESHVASASYESA